MSAPDLRFSNPEQFIFDAASDRLAMSKLNQVLPHQSREVESACRTAFITRKGSRRSCTTQVEDLKA
jgi:hypothetical protein